MEETGPQGHGVVSGTGRGDERLPALFAALAPRGSAGSPQQVVAPALEALCGYLGVAGVALVRVITSVEGARRLQTFASIGEGVPPRGMDLDLGTDAVGARVDERIEVPRSNLGPWGPLLLVGVRGVEVHAVMLAGGAPRPDGSRVDVVAPVGHLLDGQLGAARVEDALVERVRELAALHRVQDAILDVPDVHALLEEVAAALIDGMSEQAGVRAEVVLDADEHVMLGADGPGHRWMAADVVVDGRVRGELRVIATTPGSRFLPEEGDLLHAVARIVGTHLAREEAASARRRSEARARRILDNLPSVVWTTRRPDRITLISRNELTAPEGDGLPTTLRLADWDDPLRFWLADAHARAFAGEAVREYITWRERRWEVHIEPLPGAAGDVEELLGVATDVTASHRAQELEARMAALVGTARVGVIGADAEGRLTVWNRGAEQLFGWRADQVLGQPLTILDPTDTSARPTLPPRDVADGRSTIAYHETKRRHRDGHDIEVGVTIAPVVDADGEVLGASAFYLDLSERNDAVREAAASRAEFDILAQQALDVVYRIQLKPSRRLDYVSPSAQRVLGLSPEVLYRGPEPFETAVHPDDRRNLVGASPEGGSHTVVLRYRRPDGERRWLEDRRSPVVVDGETVAVAGIIRDITDRERAAQLLQTALERERQATEQLRHIDSMKSAFLSAVSHELRTPLTSVVGFAETAQRLLVSQPVAASVDDAVRRVLANARRLERLIADLLDVDRLTRGDVQPKRESVQLEELVRRAAERYATSERRIDVRTQPVEAAVDRVMIDRAVDNLVRNATRHTPAGSTVWVTLTHEVAEAVITVADDGPGVSHDLWETIFEPFQQGHGVAASASPGTGIGLSLVERFVGAHGGSVVVDERDGGGARFTLRLPVAAGAGGTVGTSHGGHTPE